MNILPMRVSNSITIGGTAEWHPQCRLLTVLFGEIEKSSIQFEQRMRKKPLPAHED